MRPNKTDTLEIYFENRKTRSLVGKLYRNTKGFRFEYDKRYYYSDNPIPLSPQLSLKKRRYQSDKLFAIFKDRIPSRDNPAYNDYCRQVGISTNERDEMVLLATLGSKGPSSFIIEKPRQEEYSNNDMKEFRKSLDVTMREFSALFGISLSSVQRIEKGDSIGGEVLKRIEIYNTFPQVAVFEILKNRSTIHSDVLGKVLNFFKSWEKDQNRTLPSPATPPKL